ncbi:MAG: cation-translocating P-type ATPase [Sulfurovum sp.]
MMLWYKLKIDEALKTLNVDQSSGLTDTEADIRLVQSGANELRQEEKASVWYLLLEQIKNPLIIILIVGVFLSLYIGHIVDAVAIMVIVLINIMISFMQELNMQKSMDSLSDMAAPMATVLRNGNWEKVPARTLVPGDILKLNTGTIVAADVRLLETTGLLIDEAALTGESVPSEKEVVTITHDEVGLGDQVNMAFMGTVVSTGHGVGVVTATGMETQMGHIADMLMKTEESKTPLQLRIEVLSKILLAAALTIVAVIVGIGIEQGMEWIEIVNTAISLTVAAIPEGLPTVVTVVLTLGAKRMVHNKALVRKLSSVETLGSASVICSDKTGTLTQNKMQVLSIYSGGHYFDVSGEGYNPSGVFTNEEGEEVNPQDIDELYHFLQMSAGCNDALLVEREGVHTIEGMPTEGALAVASAKANITKQGLIDEGAEFVHSFPFDSTRKLMSIVVKTNEGQHYVIAKGAPDVLLQRSDSIYLHKESVAIDSDTEKHIHEAIDHFSTKALRTLAVAYKAIEPEHLQLTQDEYESGFTFLGIHGIMDPPRKEVPVAIEECRTAGIRTIMITGDHAGTAEAIARQIGMKRSDSESVFTGSEIEAMTETELIDAVGHAVVFARVTPEHKLRIVKALQSRGEVVAMTGDGVNDAPALRTANIGVAMGITGTDVAKDASDLVLLDDNFSTIVKAVREGRRIYDNLRKFIRQGLTANVSEVSALLFAFLLMGDDPLLTLAPLMILWVNLISDGIPSLALGVDNEEEGIMKRKPVSSKEGFFADNLASKIVLRGLLLGFTTYFLFQYALDKGATLQYAQTIAFMTLIFGQIFHIFDARTFSTLYRRNPWSNHYLLAAVGGSALISIALIYSGVGTVVFGTEALTFKHLVMVIAIAALPTFVLSGIKEIFRIKWI